MSVELFLQNKLLVSLFSVDQNAIVVSCDRLAQKSEEPTQKDSDFVQLLCPKTVTLWKVTRLVLFWMDSDLDSLP